MIAVAQLPIVAEPHTECTCGPAVLATPPWGHAGGASLRESSRARRPLCGAARTRKARQRRVSDFRRRLDAGRALVAAEGNRQGGYVTAKRAMDIAGSLALLVLLSPVMLTAFLVLWVTTRGRPIFRQVRLGRQGRPFVLYKFRTMVLDAEKRLGDVANEQSGPVFKNRRDPRITRFGHFLRRTSLDELPQLFNVLFGAMSLVGPRPPLASEVARYQPWQRRRLAVQPGLTCLWQVSGRCEIGFEDWVRMDLWYVRNQTLGADLKLLVKTPWTVLTGRGAY